jgi:hypothetical protein
MFGVSVTPLVFNSNQFIKDLKLIASYREA